MIASASSAGAAMATARSLISITPVSFVNYASPCWAMQIPTSFNLLALKWNG